MRSVRNAYYFPGYSTSSRLWRRSGVYERRQVPSEPQHMFGLMVMLLGLQLMGPALLTSTGHFNRVMAMFPASLPHVLTIMAFVGGLIVIGGLKFFLDGLRRSSAP